MTYLLDADTVSFAIRGQGGVRQALRRHRSAGVFVSTVTEAELRFGCRKSGSHQLSDQIERFLNEVIVLSFDGDAARQFAVIRVQLERSGQPIGNLDTMVAAVAMSRSLTLVTHNLRHFQRIPGLDCEDWY